jgi:hypothetical protein
MDNDFSGIKENNAAAAGLRRDSIKSGECQHAAWNL